ncbi:phospholipase effector Tle1 domain-containing protein [Iodobacter arcticus]|uniref:Phospholipase effector Tle1 domain-containing protein n=1 Tax=Iodobacter arcticus TaxID=590593 RepID=A0ABW2R0D3_9NEIS
MSNAKTDKAERIKAEARDLCPACDQTLWLSFYFDAFAHHKDDDGAAISNMGKLWRTSLDIPVKGIFSNYYSGLGARFEPERKVLLKMEAAKIKKEAEEGVIDAVKEKLKEAVMATVPFLYKAGKEVVQNRPGWWDRVKALGKQGGRAALDPYKPWWDIVWKPNHRAQFIRRVTRDWLNYANDLIHNPLQIHKMVRGELGKMAASHSIEHIGFVRDAKWVSALFNTGVDTRLEQAEYDFKNNVTIGQTLGTIKHINVAIFGADFGGALALAFANHLVDEICEGGKYDGIRVHFRFMGLLDCVSARFDDNFLTGFLPIANSVKDDLKLPKSFEKVVHYAAAHEYRLYKPLSIIGGARAPGGRLEERLFPGDQGDVIGGYADKEQGLSPELARMPLQWMLNRAWRNGVPVMTLEKIEKTAPALYSSIRLDGAVSDLVYQYWAKASELASTTETVTSALVIKSLRQGYSDTGLACAQLSLQTHTKKQLPADIKAELAGHIAMHTAWLKSWYESFKAGKGTNLENARYQMLKNEIDSMARRSARSALEPGGLDEESKKLWAMWQNNRASNLGESKKLFEKYIHDSMADSPLERAWDDFVYSRHYLNHRIMTPIEENLEKDFFELSHLKLVAEAANKINR